MYNQDGIVGRYQKYFEKWDEEAAVRIKPNKYRFSNGELDSELKSKRWFLPAGVIILNHPLLKDIDQSQEQYLLGRFLLQFLEYGTILEHEFFNVILAELALGETGIPIPDRMRLDAFKIYTGEAYHAYFNLEATQIIRNYIGLSTEDAWPLKNSRLNSMRDLPPQNDRHKNFLVRLGIAIASENNSTKRTRRNYERYYC